MVFLVEPHFRWSTLTSKLALSGVLAGPPRAAEEAELGCGASGGPHGTTNRLHDVLNKQHPQVGMRLKRRPTADGTRRRYRRGLYARQRQAPSCISWSRPTSAVGTGRMG